MSLTTALVFHHREARDLGMHSQGIEHRAAGPALIDRRRRPGKIAARAWLRDAPRVRLPQPKVERFEDPRTCGKSAFPELLQQIGDAPGAVNLCDGDVAGP
jgi:hypothetical protein